MICAEGKQGTCLTKKDTLIKNTRVAVHGSLGWIAWSLICWVSTIHGPNYPGQTVPQLYLLISRIQIHPANSRNKNKYMQTKFLLHALKC